MLGPGFLKEVEKATTMVFVGHFIWRVTGESVNSIARGCTGDPAPNTNARAVTMVDKRRIVAELGGHKPVRIAGLWAELPRTAW